MSTFQERIAELLAGPPKISQAALARACGIKPPSVHDWVSGKTKSIEGENLLRAAAFLKVSPLWLATGKGPMRPSHQQSEDMAALTLSPHANVGPAAQPHRASKEYPLISWVAAGCWQESCDNFEPGIADEWLMSDANAGPHGYWLAVKGASMLPQFTEGVRILVQPEGFDLVSGKFYIAKMLDTGETTFKQYVRDAGLEFLQPLNNQFPTLQITDNVRIIGRVVDAKIAPSLLL